jgi:hypothetical protein
MVVNETITNATNVVAQNNTIGDAMIYITNKLGVASTELVTIYAKVQAGIAMVDFASSLAFWGILIGMVLWYFGRRIPKTVKEYDELQEMDLSVDEKDTKETLLLVKTFVYGVLTFLLPFVVSGFVFAVGVIILKILFPDFYAIQALLNQFQAFMK